MTGKTARSTYLRFGPVPEGGRSRNHLHDRELGGLSVYHVTKKGNVYIVDGDAACHPTLSELAVQFIEGDRKAFLVTGVEIGQGPDGEPLIGDVEVLSEVPVGQVNDFQTRIGRALYAHRLDEIAGGNLFDMPPGRRVMADYFRAHAREEDLDLTWYREERFMDDEVLRDEATRWYYGE